MSYCRWSSNGFQCDVYCYEHVYGGFMIHVARNRHVSDEPRPEPYERYISSPVEEFMVAYKKHSDWMDGARLEPIGLACDGETFEESSADSAADRLEELRRLGYLVPQDAIDSLREEAKS